MQEPQPLSSAWPTRLYQSDDADRCRRVASDYPLATLCAAEAGAPVIGHGPVLVEGERVIVHLSRLNPFADVIRRGDPCACLFHGPNCFVSSRWYENLSAPTWNFVIVRATAKAMRVITDDVEIRKVLMRLVKFHEDRVGEGFMPKLTQEYLDGMVPEIIMAELLDIEWWGLFKLSQNKTESEQARVRGELSAMGGIAGAVAGEMELDHALRGMT